MSQSLKQYSVDTHPLRHPLLLAPPDTVPPVDELEMVQAELRTLKDKALKRARKADDDLKFIEGAMKRMREQEKGKAKASAKVKREPSYTPSLDQNDRSFSPSIVSVSGNAASTSVAPVVNVPSPTPKMIVEMRKPKKKDKDKKRKRDDESDGEHDTPRPRKFSPHPPAVKEHHYKPSKLSTVTHPKASAGQDWSLPPNNSLLPSRPPPIKVPEPGPRRPVEVKEDFSKAKAPTSQVPINTFYTSIEPWLRPIREEDVGWLEYTADEVEPFVVPPLGRHYTEQWEEDDQAVFGGIPSVLDFSSSRNAASSSSIVSGPLPKWDSSSITDADLPGDKGLGPVAERLVSALLPAADQSTWKSIMEAEETYEAKVASGSAMNVVSPPREKVFVADFEERVKDTARFYGMLDGEPNFSQVIDDPISTALRQAQRQLREVIATNKARKRRLTAIAKDRLAYQEYVEGRDAIDKSITATFTKLQKKDGPKASKKKKKSDVNGANGVNGVGGPPVPLPNPASIGLGPDEEDKLVVPESLKNLVDTRRSWVDYIGGAFEEMEHEFPGRPRGLPDRSVFEGVEEEVRRELGRSDILFKRDRMNGVSPTATGASSTER